MSNPESELERLTVRPAKPAASTQYEVLPQYEVLRERFAKMEQELLSTGVSRYLLWLEYKQQIPEGYQ